MQYQQSSTLLNAWKCTVLVDVGEHPDLAEHVVGQLGLLHLLLGLRAGDFAVHRPDRLELAVELGAEPGHDPLAVEATCGQTYTDQGLACCIVCELAKCFRNSMAQQMNGETHPR